MSFEGDMAKFTVKLDHAIPVSVLPNFASALQDSIVDGSTITGSPGQPVDTGALRNSWQLQFLSPTIVRVVTNTEYAPFVEDGVNRYGTVTYHNHGPHSVKITLAGAQSLLDRVVKEAAA